MQIPGGRRAVAEAAALPASLDIFTVPPKVDSPRRAMAQGPHGHKMAANMRSTRHPRQRQHFPRSSQPVDFAECFVMMPIKKGFDEIYTHVIKPLLADLGIRAVRGDEIYSSNPIVEDIWAQIQKAGWLVADL